MRTVAISVDPGGTSLAELDVVDVLGNRRRLAADRAVGVAAELDLGEGGRERVEEEQPADEAVADPDPELDRLVRLQRADDPRQDTEHAALGATRGQLGRRRLREQAAVARALVGL